MRETIIMVNKMKPTEHGYNILHDEHIAKNFQQGIDLDEITILALFWAIWKVIK